MLCRTPSINYSGVIVQGRNLLSLVPGGISLGRQLSGKCCSSGDYSAKNVQGTKIQGEIGLGGIS